MLSFLLTAAKGFAGFKSLFDTTCIGYLPHRLASPFDWGCYNHMGSEKGTRDLDLASASSHWIRLIPTQRLSLKTYWFSTSFL